jgi:hypothetical protein
MLPKLLNDAGYGRVKYQAYAIEFSAGTEAYEGFYQDYEAGFHLGKEFFVKLGLATDEKYENLYQQVLCEMRADDFCAISYNLTVWAEKPKYT